MAVKKKRKKLFQLSRKERTAIVHDKLLEEAKRVGVISNERACEVSGIAQSWYHLNALVEAGRLKRAGYNQWMPVGRR